MNISHKKTNGLRKKNYQYSVTICIDSIQTISDQTNTAVTYIPPQ